MSEVGEVHTVTCRSFLNTAVKMTLKLVDFDEVTDKNKIAAFLWPTMYLQTSVLSFLAFFFTTRWNCY